MRQNKYLDITRSYQLNIIFFHVQDMFVLIRGEPCLPRCEVIGLDILATRHPKLFGLVVERMGFNQDQNNVGNNVLSQVFKFSIVHI